MAATADAAGYPFESGFGEFPYLSLEFLKKPSSAALTKTAASFYDTRLDWTLTATHGPSDGCPQKKTLQQPDRQTTLSRSLDEASDQLLPPVQYRRSHAHHLPQVRLLPGTHGGGALGRLIEMVTASRRQRLAASTATHLQN